MSMHDMPSLGTATGSRVDSAAKHIMACKVDSRLLGCWTTNITSDPTSYLHTNKMKWCMHKDEIVLNTTKKKNNEDSSAKAYPMVVTTVGEMHAYTKTYIASLYGQAIAYDFFDVWDSDDQKVTASIKQHNAGASAEEIPRALQQIRTLPEFRCQGVALGQAWASYMSGDTVASVLVGGMMTVLNGHYTMHTGDEVQWYFDFERPLFQCGHTNPPNGFRLPTNNSDDHEKELGPKRQKRADYFDQRLYGTGGGYGKSQGVKDTSTVVRIKSYRMHSHGLLRHDHYGDKIRVFAKCISGGRPFDMVDIMLMTQSS